MSRSSKSINELSAYGDLFMPEEAAEPILAPPIRRALTNWLEEIWAEAALLEVGIKPRTKALFDGAPGVGKTTLAHHLAARLGIPMLAVRPDRLLSKWVNQTGEQIGNLFETARALIAAGQHLLLFLDEFDTLAPKRSEVRQTADREANKAVNVLLQRLEQHKGYIIAATNFGGHIDEAMWRRFDIHITLELPGDFERFHILRRYLSPFGLPEFELEQLADSTATASPALLRKLCEAIKREIVLGPVIGSPMDKLSVMERVLETIAPHRDAGKPRLWSHGVQDLAVRNMTWPLPKAADVIDPPASGPQSAAAPANVVNFGDRR